MTKTEYRNYISSPQWQARRKEFLSWSNYCEACDLPRWLAIIVYDQDLHVHHMSYANIGHELDNDLASLCRRCHEIETFGGSSLRAPRKFKCQFCDEITFDLVDRICPYHRAFLELGNCSSPVAIQLKRALLEQFDASIR